MYINAHTAIYKTIVNNITKSLSAFNNLAKYFCDSGAAAAYNKHMNNTIFNIRYTRSSL